MKPLLPALLLGVGLSTATVTPAIAYPVDCAILLCLAGGWPASAECAHARAVFIRRITPWPIEPPLQLWNCPMRVSFRGEAKPIERLYSIAVSSEQKALFSIPETLSTLLFVQDHADIDLSDPAFNFVRSIKVFQIEYSQRKGSDDDCNVSTKLQRGTYGEQGDFSWSYVSDHAIPSRSQFNPPERCEDYRYRSVFVEWHDAGGEYGSEEVEY